VPRECHGDATAVAETYPAAALKGELEVPISDGGKDPG
jgi:hypothetical protein